MALIQLDENINIKGIKKFYTELGDILGRESSIMIDFSNVKSIDLSIAQLIIAANRTAVEKNTIIKIKGISEKVASQLELAGLGMQA